MKKLVFNPYLPSYEYIPDGEPYVFGDRLYVYGSHDCFAGKMYCMNDYVCWSAPVTDLSDWRYEGVIFEKTQDPMNRDGKHCLYAPDVAQGTDGRYYLYYAFDFVGIMSVAVCDTPAGRYEFLGSVKFPDGHAVGSREGDIFQFDPGILVDDDGRVFLYSGFSAREEMLAGGFSFGNRRIEGAYVMELEPDMLTVKRGPELMLKKKGAVGGGDFAGFEFFEASSIRKINGRYYFIYSDDAGHALCYAVSDRPDGGFVFGGMIVSNSDVGIDGRALPDALNYMGNNHGSIAEVNGQWYVFYHRQTNFHQFSRQGCAEAITILPDGSIPQVEMTSCGLNGGPLPGTGVYEARIACHLRSKEGACFCPFDGRPADAHPYFTQEGADREADGNQYIANFQDGALCGFRYFMIDGATTITVKIRGTANGELRVSAGLDAATAAALPIQPSTDWTEVSAPLTLPNGKQALYFTFSGEGAMDFYSFTLA